MLHRSRPLQPGAQQQQQQSHLLDLLDVSVNDAAVGWVDPWGTPAHPSEPPVPVMPPRPKVSHLSFFFKRFFFFSGNSTPFLERFFRLFFLFPLWISILFQVILTTNISVLFCPDSLSFFVGHWLTGCRCVPKKAMTGFLLFSYFKLFSWVFVYMCVGFDWKCTSLNSLAFFPPSVHKLHGMSVSRKSLDLHDYWHANSMVWLTMYNQ